MIGEIRQNFTKASASVGLILATALVGVTRSGLVGRPRLQVLQEHLQNLHNDAGFRRANIGRILGISDQTLRHRRLEFGLQVGMGEHFSDITDDEQ